jgi:hypothetical protein
MASAICCPDSRPPVDATCQGIGAGLLALGRARWATTPPTNLRDLAERLQQGRNEIDALDRILYGNEQESWDGAALWAVIAGVDWQADGKTPGGNDQSLIPPLYPQNV